MRKFNHNTSHQASKDRPVEPPTSTPPLEKLVFLHNLYPKHFLEFMLSERVIQYTKSNLQALLDKTIPKTEKPQGANFSFSEVTDKIDFCPFLVGYKKEVASAFRHTLRVKRILKETNSHIISVKKYLKYKEEFLEEHRAFLDAKENDIDLSNSSYNFLLVTRYGSLEEMEANSLEEIQKRLLGANSPGDFILKTTQIFELPTAFEEEIKIDPTMFKDITKKYEKLVAITPKTIKQEGKYYVTFILTSFSEVYLFDKIEEELSHYFNYKKEIQLNHFELSYWKKRLQPSLKDLETTLNIHVKFTEYHLSTKDDWISLFEKSHSNGRLEMVGQRINVGKFFDKVKFAFDQLHQYRVEVPIKMPEWIFYDFKAYVWNWFSLIDAKLPEITFTNHAYQQEERKEEKNNFLLGNAYENNAPQNQSPSKSLLVFYAIGPKDLRKEVEAAGARAGRAVSHLQFQQWKSGIEELRALAERTGFKNLDELQNCFEILIKENNDNQKLPKIYGRKEDLLLFSRFQKERYVMFDSKRVLYQEILLQTEEAEMAAKQCYVDIKVFPHVPKILILGSPENIDNFLRNFLEKKIQSLQEKTKQYPTEATEWLSKKEHSQTLRRLSRKYDVHPGELDQIKKKLTLVGEEPKCLGFLQEISLLVFGKPISKEINIEGSDTNPEALLNQAKKLGLEAQFKDKEKAKGKDRNIILVKGLYPIVKEFKNLAVKKEIREADFKYPKYWHHDAEKSPFKMRYLQETHPEYQDISQIFNDTMKDFASVKKIQRIQNEPLVVNFLKLHQLMERKNNASKMYCFYASGDFNPAQIYKDFEVGFDLQFSNDAQKKGFWFSLDAKEAHDNHAFQAENGIFKMLIVDVIITNKVDVNKKEFLVDSGYLCYPIYLIEYINKK